MLLPTVGKQPQLSELPTPEVGGGTVPVRMARSHASCTVKLIPANGRLFV